MTEENARTVIRLLVANGVEADGDVQNAAVQKWAADAGVDEDILAEGLRSAGERGWIESGLRQGTIKLTRDGSEIGKAS